MTRVHDVARVRRSVEPLDLLAASTRQRSVSSLQDAFMRALDIVGTVLALVVALPVVVLGAVAILIVDGRPIFFRQERVGMAGQPFTILKLRTMYNDADSRLADVLAADAAARQEFDRYLRIDSDPRILPTVGRVLRCWSVDEVPQLVNVLRGQMSLVGPRPLPAHILHRLPDKVVSIRGTVKPGLTGLWQVRGRSDNEIEGFGLDVEYVANRSLLLNLRILLATPFMVCRRVGAY